MSTVLRILPDMAHEPAFNMAADMHLLHTCMESDEVCLRIYTWEPPCISIGYMQKADHVLDLEKCREDGVAWIQRPTGGRAVLHKEDVTYSVVFRKNIQSMGTTITETYALISQALVAAFGKLGIECQPHDTFIDSREVRREVKLPCFLAPNRDEIMTNGKKLVGSAQKRTNTGVLQHGSIPLTPAFRDMPYYETINDHQKKLQQRLLQQKCGCINEFRPTTTRNEVVQAIVEAFSEVLPMEAATIPWTSDEVSAIQELANSQNFLDRWLGP